MKTVVKDILITVGILITAFFISIWLKNAEIDEHISTLFAFAVFIISLLTKSYVYGIASAFLGTLAINYAFTFPYFAFNFTIPENLISAIVMVTIALLTGALTTKIKRQEALKAESERERMRANLLRAVSHDLRTPLTTIYGSASALLDQQETLSDAQKSKMLKSIKDDSDWLVRMVENLLSVTRIDSGRVKLAKMPIVIDELLHSAVPKFKKRYPDCPLSLAVPEETVIVPMDAMLIEQVIINILENAVIHGEGLTKLELRVTDSKGKAVFEIEDDGCGISEDRLPSIFEGYLGCENTVADRKKRNAGIGLSVCATIINAHGGEITAKNIKPHGALFSFTLDSEVNGYE